MRDFSNPQSSVIWTRFFPLLRWWPWVNRTTLRSDCYAGLTGAVIVLPQAVAFALIAGLPPAFGLYTAMVPPIIAALFGSSRHLISGPTTAISLVVFATVSKIAEPGTDQYLALVLTLTMLAGSYQLALGLARMGRLVNFVSHSVVVGFTAGAAILIATSQFKYFLGISVPSGEPFIYTLRHILSNIDHVNPYVVAVATITLLSAILFRQYRPRWPGMLFAMIIGGLAAFALGGVKHEITVLGEIPARLPPLSMADFSFKSIQALGSGALAIALLGLVEAVSIGRSIALKSGQRIDANQEFIGQGLANIVGSFFSSYASSGSFTRSGINYAAGGVTPLASIIAAVALALAALIVAPLTGKLPYAAMAGILMVVAYRLIDAQYIRKILSTSKREAGVLIATLAATLFFELVFAIYVGVILSLLIYLMRTSQPAFRTRVPDPSSQKRYMVTDPNLPECPQLKIVRVDGSLYFGAVDHVQEYFQYYASRFPEQKHLLLLTNGMNFLDVTGAEVLAQEAERRRALGGGLYLSKVKDDVRDTLRRGRFIERIGEENLFASKADAIEKIFKRLDHQICAVCDKRIFLECRQVEYTGAPRSEAFNTG